MAEHAAGTDDESDPAQVGPGPLHHPALGADHHPRSAGVTTQRQTHGGAGDLLVLVLLRLGGRARSRGRPATAAASVRSASPAASAVQTADQRIPRSPSTVRVTGLPATTSRARPSASIEPSSGSTSTTECTSVVAPPTSTTTTSPDTGTGIVDARASSSTPASTTSGVAPRTIAVKSAPRAQVLAADHVGEEDLPYRAPRGLGRQDADPGDDVVREHVGHVPEVCGDLGPCLDIAGDHHRPGPAARHQVPSRGHDHLGVPAVGPPLSRTTSASGADPPVIGRPVDAAAMTETTLPPLESATRRPASAVTSSSAPTTAIRRPPPALEQASTSASAARASCSTRAARQASYPSRTSVSIVVGCSAPRRSDPLSGRPVRPW